MKFGPRSILSSLSASMDFCDDSAICMTLDYSKITIEGRSGSVISFVIIEISNGPMSSRDSCISITKSAIGRLGWVPLNAMQNFIHRKH